MLRYIILCFPHGHTIKGLGPGLQVGPATWFTWILVALNMVSYLLGWDSVGLGQLGIHRMSYF